MSKYTTEVRYICETAAGYDESQGADSIDAIVNKTADALMGNYPIFDESYRHVLNVKIIKHYYLREIGQETAGIWKFFLQRKMQEIMPYYNQLYKSQLLEFNPLYDVDVYTERTSDGAGQTVTNGSGTSSETISGSVTDSRTEDTESHGRSEDREAGSEKTSSTGSSNSSTDEDTSRDNTHWDLFQDTPQGGLDGVEDQDYLTDARKITDAETAGRTTDSTTEDRAAGERLTDNTSSGVQDTTGKLTASGEQLSDSTRSGENETKNRSEYTNLEQYADHVFGKRGGATYSGMLIEFRNTFLNIDMMIIDELEDLFFQLW